MSTISIESTYQNRPWETPTSAPSRYTGLNKQCVSGIWRDGNEGSKLIDADPFTGETLAEIVQSKEAGSARMKAELEWQWVYSITMESASFPHRLEGKMLPIDERGKESRAYKQPLGVIGVIGPWNVPMMLSQRSNCSRAGAGEPRRRETRRGYAGVRWFPVGTDL